MFGNSGKKSVGPTANVDTLIGSHTVIRGDVHFAGGLHIDGQVVGKVTAEGNDAVLVLSDKGSIEGEIRAPHVVINGIMRGDIVASERIELAANARVTGNIFYKMLEMTAGAQVNGQIVRQEEPQRQLTGPDSPPAG